MKTKSIVLFMTTLILTTVMSWAQAYRIPVQNSSDEKLSLLDFMDYLPIEGYDGDEIIISSASGDVIVVPDRAHDLVPVYSNGTDNTGLGLNVEKSGNQITVRCLLPITKRGQYKLRIPNNLSIKIESGCDRSNEIAIQKMRGEIEIKTCQSISLRDVTGPLVLSTVGGEIDIELNSVKRDKSISINSISGDIDITIPAKTSAELEISTITGKISSDFDLPSDKDDMKQIGGKSLQFALNGGGVDFNIVSVSGDIYLKSGK
jgi:lia operon protein LiaG